MTNHSIRHNNEQGTSNMNHPPKQRRIQYYTHGKYAEESAVGDLAEQDDTGTPGTSTNSTTEATSSAATTQVIGSAAAAAASTTDIVVTANTSTIDFIGTTNNTASPGTTHQNTTRRPYPLRPSTPKAATTHTLFSDPQAFNLSTIYNSTHYLSTSLRGKLWWDVNGDGKRGEYGNATLNEMEYDYGLSNVGEIVLVSCNDDDDDDDDEGPKKMASAASAPFNGRDATLLRQSLVAQAGIYDFLQIDTVPSGRYYVMYKAPLGWRLTGNVLPLDREEMENQTGSYECIPWGGNGGAFSEQARDEGDFDQHGYCARSIGCVEIGSRSELEDKFEKLELLEDTDYYKNVIQGDTEMNRYGMNGMAYTGGKMVALPTPYVLDVGLVQEEWKLQVKQYADATVTLRFHVAKEEPTMLSPFKSELAGVFANTESFGTSMHRKTVGAVLEKYLKENIEKIASGGHILTKDSEAPVFELSGVDLFDAKIERITKNKKDAIQSYGRYLRASRNAQEDDEVMEITYSLTARGSYNPPPHDQLGYFVEDSINADSDNFVRTLREDNTLPFQDLESADSTHLTVESPAPRACDGCVGIQAVSTDDSGGMAEWATILVSLFSLMIVALICLFLSRRIWKLRREVQPDKDRKMGTKDFAVSYIDIKNKQRFTADENGSKECIEKPKRKKKKHAKGESSDNHSDNASFSDTSEGSNPNSPHAKEVDSSSSSSSEDSELQRRRHRKERRAKKARKKSEGTLANRDDPPTLEDLHREKKKSKKRTSKRRDRNMV
ncbi:hypothetical protein ACHAW6_008191 [Cyclotella cf. meneghiniana]